MYSEIYKCVYQQSGFHSSVIDITDWIRQPHVRCVRYIFITSEFGTHDYGSLTIVFIMKPTSGLAELIDTKAKKHFNFNFYISTYKQVLFWF